MLRSKLSYLNFILTVIAIGLTVIVLQNANVIPTVNATSYSGLPLNEKGEMVVRVANSDMDVTVTNEVEVVVTRTWGNIPVEIQ